ncbi:MAG: virulence factor, partial [Anaerolineales bacterium]
MPAVVEVLYWREIPAVVKARGPFGSARVELPERFARAIRSAAKKLGITSEADNLDQYYWKTEGDREGSAERCAETFAGELDAAYPPSRLRVLVEL